MFIITGNLPYLRQKNGGQVLFLSNGGEIGEAGGVGIDNNLLFY
jgi:hypothetical protein